MTHSHKNNDTAPISTSGNAPPRHRLKVACAITVLGALGALVVPGGGGAQTQIQPNAAQTQNNSPQKKALKTAPPAAQPKAISGPLANIALDSLFLEEARKVKATASCASVYAKLGRNLTAGSTFTIKTQAENPQTGKCGIQGVIGMNYSNPSDYSGPAGGVILAVPTEKGCEGNMVRVVPYPQSCASAQGFLPQGSRPQPPLSGLDIAALPGGGQALFIPAVSGCVVVSFGTL